MSLWSFSSLFLLLLQLMAFDESKTEEPKSDETKTSEEVNKAHEE